MKKVLMYIIVILYIIVSLPLIAENHEKSTFDIFKSGSLAEIKAVLEDESIINNSFSEKENSENTETEIRYTPLEIAARFNPDPDVVKLLIEKGMDDNQKNEYGATPFLASALNPNVEMIKLFLNRSPDIKQANKDGRNALMIAAEANSNPQVIIELIKAGFAVKDRDNSGYTPLLLAAAENRNPEIIAVLIKKGAQISDRGEHGYSSLLLAAKNNSNPEVINALIKAGSSIKERNEFNATPLLVASQFNKSPAIISALIKAGATVGERDGDGGFTPLLRAIDGNNNAAVVEMLLKAGSSVKETTQKIYGTYSSPYFGNGTKIIECKNGWSPLSLAAVRNDDAGVIELLIKNGASVNEKCNYTVTIPDSDTRSALKMFGVKGSVNEGMTPLMLAAMSASNPDVVSALLKAGANPKTKNKNGETAFDLAKKNGSLENTPAYWALQEAQYK
jgi:ankyrin repeat protein